jgi:hypothetical protein
MDEEKEIVEMEQKVSVEGFQGVFIALLGAMRYNEKQIDK